MQPTRTNQSPTSTNHMMQQILKEVQSLRNDLALILPAEDINEYEHSDRIQKSYHSALKEHPPIRYGNNQNK
jgi:hypothetical protein